MSKESDDHSGVVSVARSPRRMPPNWQPPAPAWATSFAQQSTPVVMVYFGTQMGSHDDERLGDRICEFFDGTDAPVNLERSKFVDRAGCRTLISAAYWTNPATYERWKDKSSFEACGTTRGEHPNDKGIFARNFTWPRI